MFAMRILLKSLAVAGGMLAATSANAALVLGDTPCALTDIAPDATACRGFYEGNLNAGSRVVRADTAAALNALLGTSYTPDSFPLIEALPSLNGNQVNFATPLYGNTVVSFHVGAAKGAATGVGYQATAFYLFNAGNMTGGLDTITLNRAGLSNARLFVTGTFQTPAVPEPATWLMLIIGFAAVGGMMRRKPNTQLRVRYA
jgi:hypothetical protein